MKSKSKSHRKLAWAVTILVLLVLPLSIFAQGAPQRVRFQSGHSSATLKGRIVGFDTKDYVVGAKAGQVMNGTAIVIKPDGPFRNLLD